MKKTIKTVQTFYEIKDPKNNSGLMGKYETPEKALEYINSNYECAKEQGYDNKHQRWIIVCVEITTCKTEKGDFLKEENVRFVMETAEYSEEKDAYVFVY